MLVMSVILTLKGRSSVLSIDFQTPILLDPEHSYGLALLSFHSYNSIPNIEKGANKFYLLNREPIVIPEGSYEISDIEAHIKKILGKEEIKDEEIFSLKANNNTLKCEIYSRKYSVDFRPEDCICNILGFSKKLLPPHKVHTSDLPVNIVTTRTIHLDSNLTSGAFYNNRPSHTIYEFAIDADPGFAIDETAQHLIYLPINRREIHNITLQILNQDSELVNFRGEEVIVRLELKQLS